MEEKSPAVIILQKIIMQIWKLYIIPSYQGMGIASRMKNIFENWLRKNNLSKYVIGVLKDNLHVRRVYEKWGGKLSTFKSSYYGTNEVFYTYEG